MDDIVLRVDVQEVATTHGDLWTWADHYGYGYDKNTVLAPTKPKLPTFEWSSATEQQAKRALQERLRVEHPDLQREVYPSARLHSPWKLMAVFSSEGRAIWYWERTVTLEARIRMQTQKEDEEMP